MLEFPRSPGAGGTEQRAVIKNTSLAPAHRGTADYGSSRVMVDSGWMRSSRLLTSEGRESSPCVCAPGRAGPRIQRRDCGRASSDFGVVKSERGRHQTDYMGTGGTSNCVEHRLDGALTPRPKQKDDGGALEKQGYKLPVRRTTLTEQGSIIVLPRQLRSFLHLVIFSSLSCF